MIYIGVDVGGTKISGALFDKNGNILFDTTLLIEGDSNFLAQDLILRLISQILSTNGLTHRNTMSIGICVPGISYSKTGLVWAPNIPGWEAFPLREFLHKQYPESKITIESDRTCYILGEVLKGAARGSKNAIFLAVGTGIGAGILIDGKILHGTSDIVGAIGWMALKPPYSNKYNPSGCLESFASGEGIAKQASDFLGRDVSTREVFNDFSNNKEYAITVITNAVEMWGMATANLVSLFNPQLLIFGGGVFGPAIELIDNIYLEACKWAQPLSIKECKFEATKLGSKAGLYGAGAIAIKNY